VTIDEVKRLCGSSQTLLQMISFTMQDAAYIVQLMCELNVLPLALQITNIAGGSQSTHNLEFMNTVSLCGSISMCDTILFLSPGIKY
jgi:hypothetical protein